MPQVDIKKQFGDRIEAIWKEIRLQNQKLEAIKALGYALPQTIQKNAVLFIGTNPSFNKGDKPGSKYYPLESNEHPYFTRFRTLSEGTGLPWAHLDLLFVRETSQKAIVSFLKDARGKAFLMRQFALSKEMLVRARPSIVMVSNTLARDLLCGGDEKLLGAEDSPFEFAFDDALGTRKIVNHPTLANTPVFFTSMLTGQRALDKGSFERLIWHCKYVHNKISGRVTA